MSFFNLPLSLRVISSRSVFLENQILKAWRVPVCIERSFTGKTINHGVDSIYSFQLFIKVLSVVILFLLISTYKHYFFVHCVSICVKWMAYWEVMSTFQHGFGWSMWLKIYSSSCQVNFLWVNVDSLKYVLSVTLGLLKHWNHGFKFWSGHGWLYSFFTLSYPV